MHYKDTKRSYEGFWKNDQRCGQGFEVYSNGSIYLGNFANGKADGVGTYTSKDGTETYVGQWV